MGAIRNNGHYGYVKKWEELLIHARGKNTKGPVFFSCTSSTLMIVTRLTLKKVQMSDRKLTENSVMVACTPNMILRAMTTIDSFCMQI